MEGGYDIPTNYLLANTAWKCKDQLGISLGWVFLETLPPSSSGESPTSCAVKRLPRWSRTDPIPFSVNHIMTAQELLQGIVVPGGGNIASRDLFVGLMGVSMDEEFVYLVEVYMENGDLRKYIDAPWSEGDVRVVARQAFQALKWMHDNGRMHLDLKPAVMFPVLGEDGTVKIKISDFGISKRTVLDTRWPLMHRMALRGYREMTYIAPELCPFSGDVESLTPGADSWSVGCILYRLLTGTNIFLGSLQAWSYFFTGKPSPRDGLVEKGVSEEGVLFIEECLRMEPGERLSAKRALEHPWLQAEEGYEVSEELREKLRRTRSAESTTCTETPEGGEYHDVFIKTASEVVEVSGNCGLPDQEQYKEPKTSLQATSSTEKDDHRKSKSQEPTTAPTPTKKPKGWHRRRILSRLSFGRLGRP